ncbi:formyltransferase family protein [Actinoplanes sp. CA-054009]
MSGLRVFVIGQKRFGAAVAASMPDDVVAVASPAFADVAIPWAYGDDEQLRPDPLRAFAAGHGVPWHEAGTLTADGMPECDVIVAAHSPIFIERPGPAPAMIGYHPSPLPLHRGRDAVRWTVRDHDRITGGTVFHLTGDVDAGPIAAQEFLLVPPGSTAESLWREHLMPLGVRLIRQVLGDLAAGRVVSVPQDETYATWEPPWPE